jgi:hypothetical protein
MSIKLRNLIVTSTNLTGAAYQVALTLASNAKGSVTSLTRDKSDSERQGNANVPHNPSHVQAKGGRYEGIAQPDTQRPLYQD